MASNRLVNSKGPRAGNGAAIKLLMWKRGRGNISFPVSSSAASVPRNSAPKGS